LNNDVASGAAEQLQFAAERRDANTGCLGAQRGTKHCAAGGDGDYIAKERSSEHSISVSVRVRNAEPITLCWLILVAGVFKPEIHLLNYLFTAIALAFDSIRAHKLRSFLTLLGVIVGVASVILVGAAIDGMGAYAEQITSKAFGTNSFLIAQITSLGRLSARQRLDKLRYNKKVGRDEVTFLRTVAGDDILYSAYQQRVADVKADNQTFEAAQIIGVSYVMPEIRDIPVAMGRFFMASEEERHKHVAVIGDDIRMAFFPGRDPMDKTIKISGVEFTVIGVLEHQGSAFGQSQDTPIYIPSPVFQSLFGGSQNLAIFGRAQGVSGLTMTGALDTTREALRSHFHTRPGKDDNFDNLTPDSVRSFTDGILSVIAAVVVPVTSISLVVGGIVIMNIMLVSVTERTREIGVRKSLGARKTDILLQFLIESLMLSLAGGAIGVAAGAILALLIGAISGTTFAITAPYIIISIFVSSMVGILSGWYPARRAANLDPVEALRAE
jgi:putative ABC transport system permease protein